MAHVYFLLDEKSRRVKIGWSRNVFARIYKIKKKRPGKYRLLVKIRGGLDLEAFFHRIFEDVRVSDSHDWFEYGEKIILFVRRAKMLSIKDLLEKYNVVNSFQYRALLD